MRLLLAAALLVANSGLAAERVVVLDFTVSDDSLKSDARTLSELVLTEVGRDKDVDVLGSSDVSALIGLERQKQLLGCSDEASSCLAEISGALGARYVVAGSLGKLGSQKRLDLKLIDTASSKVLAREGALVANDDELVSAARRGIASVRAGLPDKQGLAKKSRVLPFTLIGAGGALLAGGGALSALALQWNSDKVNQQYSEAERTRSAAQTQLTLGYALAGVGLASVIGGIVLLSTDDGAAVSLAPTAGGAYARFQVTLP